MELRDNETDLTFLAATAIPDEADVDVNTKGTSINGTACCDDAPFDVPMAVDVDDDDDDDEEEEGDEEDADDDDDDNDGDDNDSANLALERATGPADTPSGGFFGGRPRFPPPEVDTTNDGSEEVKEDETADTNDDGGIEGRGGKDEGNDKQADDDEEYNDTPVGSVPSEGAPPVSVPFFGGRPRYYLHCAYHIEFKTDVDLPVILLMRWPRKRLKGN